jgi:GT2 family glycosyltransferase
MAHGGCEPVGVKGRGAPASDDAPLISIVIVSWNVSPLLSRCLRSIEGDSPELAREVIVVDNASADDSVAMVRREFPRVKVIASAENLGFARGNNLALAHVRGRFVFFLNPDTELKAGALSTLTRFLETHPQAGIVGPRIESPEGALHETCARRMPSFAQVLLADVLMLHRWPPFRSGPLALRPRSYDHRRRQAVEAISGSAMVVRQQLLGKLGGFGHRFHHCGEDIELCARSRSAGWEVWYEPGATVSHVGQGSSKKAPLRVYVQALLSYEEYFRRCHSEAHAFAYRCIVRYVGVPAIVASGLLRPPTASSRAARLSERLRAARAVWSWRPL